MPYFHGGVGGEADGQRDTVTSSILSVGIWPCTDGFRSCLCPFREERT